MDAAGAPRGVGLAPAGVDFVYTGGVERQRDPRLVVLMLDHSSSLVGVDPDSGAFDGTRASDPDDQRIAFFQSLVDALPEEHLLSLVPFSGNFAWITEEYSAPTRDRSAILEGLSALQFDESGATPLTRALNDTRTRVIDPRPGANPVVILFTDGVESGDPTDVDGGFADAVAGYADRGGAPIPVIVLHLQPPAGVPAESRGRDAALAELACRTGGEYIFLDEADAFTARPDLLLAVLNRLDGVWRLRADSTLSSAAFAPGAWLVSTQIGLAVAERVVTAALQRSPPGGAGDARAWFVKR